MARLQLPAHDMLAEGSPLLWRRGLQHASHLRQVGREGGVMRHTQGRRHGGRAQQALRAGCLHARRLVPRCITCLFRPQHACNLCRFRPAASVPLTVARSQLPAHAMLAEGSPLLRRRGLQEARHLWQAGREAGVLRHTQGRRHGGPAQQALRTGCLHARRLVPGAWRACLGLSMHVVYIPLPWRLAGHDDGTLTTSAHDMLAEGSPLGRRRLHRAGFPRHPGPQQNTLWRAQGEGHGHQPQKQTRCLTVILMALTSS